MTDWSLVTLESPYAGDVMTNTRYARACIADAIKRGEGQCVAARCKKPNVLVHIETPLCQVHWEAYCEVSQ